MTELLILGGGFAGLWAALVARRRGLDCGRNIDIALISDSEYLTIKPRLYEANPERLRVPLRPVLETVDVHLIKNRVARIDAKSRLVVGDDQHQSWSYDRLVLALGNVSAPFSVPGWQHAFNLNNWPAAMRFDEHLRRCVADKKQLNLVVVGGGFTGIEIALELPDRIKAVSDYSIAQAAKITLLDRADVIGPELGSNPRPAIEAAIMEAGIDLKLGAQIHRLDPLGVTLASGQRIAADAIIISTGLLANPLTEQIDARRDDKGRLIVKPDLQVAGVPGVYAAGDVAHAAVDDDGHIALMSCQHAMIMGRFAGYNAASDILGQSTTPYRQERYVTCLDLGRSGAVFTTGWDRQVEHTGAAAKQMKTRINRQVIYPPEGSKQDILRASSLYRDGN